MGTGTYDLIDGDINDDGEVNAADILLITRFINGSLIPTPDEAFNADVAPLVNGVPTPDGIINIADLLVIQRKALGEINF